MRCVNRGDCRAATATKARAGGREEEASGAGESVSMFYSCRAFPVSANNGEHGSPLPAPWPFSVALENRAPTPGGTVPFRGKIRFSPARSLACNAFLSEKFRTGISPLAASVQSSRDCESEFLDMKYTSHVDLARFSLTIVARRYVSGARPEFIREYLDRRPKRLNRSLCNGSTRACVLNKHSEPEPNGTKTVYRFWVAVSRYTAVV